MTVKSKIEESFAGLPETRAEAIAEGCLKYFTGRKCKRGHIAPRYACNAVCLECINPGSIERQKPEARPEAEEISEEERLTRKRAYYQENKQKIKRYKQKYWIKHKEKLKLRNKKYYEENKERIKITDRARYLRNRDQILERKRQYAQEKREQALKEKNIQNSNDGAVTRENS